MADCLVAVIATLSKFMLLNMALKEEVHIYFIIQ